MASSHYENFPVASWLVPKGMRKGLVAVYAIARLGDDIADEEWEEATNTSHLQADNSATLPEQPPTARSTDERLHLLEQLDRIVDLTDDHEGHPVFWAIQDTIRRHHLPADPFHRLFEAFRRDTRGNVKMKTWDEVLDYCHHSANPVGELMLRLSDDWSAQAEPYSNSICTALQITNFMQDITVDISRRRFYIPDMPCDPLAAIEQSKVALNAARTFTQLLFERGAPVVRVPHSLLLRLELRAIIAGGKSMLNKCDERVFIKRPKN